MAVTSSLPDEKLAAIIIGFAEDTRSVSSRSSDCYIIFEYEIVSVFFIKGIYGFFVIFIHKQL